MTHGRKLSAEQLQQIKALDEQYLSQVNYQLFCFRNQGRMRLTWRGYAAGNGQVFLSVWNGRTFETTDLRDVFPSQTRTQVINLPASERVLYVLVNCTLGTIHTDGIFCEPLE